MKLKNDSFTLADLGIPFIGKDTKISYDTGQYPVYTGRNTMPIITGSRLYYFHKSIGNNEIEICEKLYRDLELINRNKYLLESKTRKPLDQSTVLTARKVLDDLSNGYIYINEICININEYEPEGEYFQLYTYDGGVIRVNRVKKYYSIISKQYTFFLSNGTIISYDDIAGIDMSKDVRLSEDELKSLWNK